MALSPSDLLAVLKQELPAASFDWSLQRETDLIRIESRLAGKGIELAAGPLLAKYEEGGRAALADVVHTVGETLRAMEDEAAGRLPKGAAIYPVIRSASFPTASAEGAAFVTSEHTAETRIYYALDLGSTYRLLDVNALKELDLTEASAKEQALFRALQLPTPLRRDEVAGNSFYFLNTNDGYDATRVLNARFLREVARTVEGEMAVSIPHQDVLILADVRNPQGYDILAQMAMHFFTEGRVPVTPLPFLYEEGALEPIFILAKTKPTEE